jgi:hypothetical protein
MFQPETTLLAAALIGASTLLGHAALLARARRRRDPAPPLHPILAVELLEPEAARAYLRSALLDLELARSALPGASLAQGARLTRLARQSLVRAPARAARVHGALDQADALLAQGASPDAWRALASALARPEAAPRNETAEGHDP